MMFPKSFFSGAPVPLSPDIEPYEPATIVTPGSVYRDALAFGVSPEGVSGCLYDDDDCTLIDAACDLTVQKTDLVDRSFYPNNPEYQTPSSLRKQDLAPTSPIPTAPPAGDSAGSLDSSQSSTSTVE